MPPQPLATPRLPVAVVDHLASTQPDRPFAFAPITNDPEDGFEPISFGALARAVDHVAHEIAALEIRAQAAADEFPTVAYIGPNDLRYLILSLACIKAHCKAFFASPRNSNAAIESMFRDTRPHLLLYADEFAQLARTWSSLWPVDTQRAPSPSQWLQAHSKPFPYTESWEEARWHPFCAVHTSGSTGIPKAVVIKQGSLGAFDTWLQQPHFEGMTFLWAHWATCSTRSLLFMPLFHTAALAHMITMGLYAAAPFVLPPPGRPLSSIIAIRCLKTSGVDSTLMPPSIIQEIAASPGGVEVLAELNLVVFGGSPLAPSVGDFLGAQGVKLQSNISSSEFIPYHIFHQSNPQLWNWYMINMESMGAEMREVENGMQGAVVEELIIRRMDLNPGLQTVFYTFPDKSEWATGDLFRRHPTLPHHYQYVGRADDVLVFSNGLKINPATIERLVAGHPGVSNALVVGKGRFQPALIVEPRVPARDPGQSEALIDNLWPIVQEANKKSPTYGRIERHLIAVLDPNVPLPTSAKGSVQRALANKQFGQLIDDLYDKAKRQDEDLEAVPLDLQSIESLTDCIVEYLTASLEVSGASPDADLFNLSVDSLQVISLSRYLLCRAKAAGVDVEKDVIAPRAIYAHMTPKSLAEHIFLSLRGGSQDDSTGDGAHEAAQLARLLEKYTSDLPPPNQTQQDPLDDLQTVIVTGTTGSLGAYLLDRLINSPRVSSIIALNRGSDGGASRQPSVSAARGLSTDFSKVVFLGADLSLPSWGLSLQTYDELLAKADRILHSAWMVNFNVGVESFESCIRGVRHLVDFSNKAAKRAPIIFVSSISAVMNWSCEAPVPEERLDNLTLPRMGYGRSKAAASEILDAAAARSGVCTASIRVGLVVGSRSGSGMWSKQEFMPSLVASSVYLGMLPDSLGCGDVIDWMPVEDVAGMILDVSGVSETRSVSEISGYFHGVNPRTTTWSSVLAAVREFYGERISRVVSLSEWVSALEKSAQEHHTADVERNPGIKLIDTYRSFLEEQKAGMPPRSFATSRSGAYSSTIREIEAINGDLMKLWCRQWNY